jgi:5-methylcytosine-specific restriction endonuclease McrA
MQERLGDIGNRMRPRAQKDLTPFHPDGGDLKRERAKARELRESQWWKRQLAKGMCHYCNRRFPARELTMDHVVAISRGGKTVKGNVVPCCKECNNAKKQLLPMEWEDYIKSWSGNNLPS